MRPLLSFIKAFNTPLKYEDMELEELNALMLIDTRIKEVESICMDLNNKR